MAIRKNWKKSRSAPESSDSDRKSKKPKFTRPDLRFHYSELTGERIYEVKASRLGKAAFKTLVKQANERLRQIEKRGLQGVSREYQLVKMYAENYPKGKGAIYNYDRKKGRIRFTSDLDAFMNESNVFQKSLRGLSRNEQKKSIQRAKADRRAYLINTLRDFLNAESSTVSGIKRIRHRAFKTFQQNVKDNDVLYPGIGEITEDQYNTFWSVYREKFADEKDTYGYDKVMRMMQTTNLMTLSPERIEEIMTYEDGSTESRDDADFVELAVDMFPDLEFNF